jgi:hypothetical protein
MTLSYSRVSPASPLVTLAEAKTHLRIVATDTASDADISAKLAAAEERVFATLGAAADPAWDATTAPRLVRHAVLILLDAFMERRGGDEGGEELRKALEVVDRLLGLYRDVSVA